MTFVERLKNHIGGLVLLKTQLYWFRTSHWDGVKDRVCLLLDAAASGAAASNRGFGPPDARGPQTIFTQSAADRAAYVLLLIDCQSKWILLSKEELEFIK
jgi:hypothetical protein